MAFYPEEFVLTPRDSVDQREVRSGYTGPKNNRGEPDTTRTDEIGVMKYPPNDVYNRYSGKWRNGEFHGQGTLINANGDTYTGEFIDGEKNGRGVYKHSNGIVREGYFENERHVRGKLIRPDYTFQGTFVNEKPRTGTCTYKNGIVREGDFENERHVRGKLIHPDYTFQGTFVNKKPHTGTFTYKNGMVREGEFENERHVRGKLIHPDYTFQGTFVNEKPHTGTFTYNNGTVFTGTCESETTRVGTFRYPDGDEFSGTFEDWKLNGDDSKMIVNSMPNKFIYEGQMRNGVRHGHGTMHIMSGPSMGEHYSARFNMDQEVRKSRVNIPKQGGTRHKRTRCRRKRLRMSKRDRKKC